MKGIMFNNKYELEKAVLFGRKTRTWRADKKPRYNVGEIVAIKQSYETVFNNNKEFCHKIGMTDEDDAILTEFLSSAGWHNKMYVNNELMPYNIRITDVKTCRLQDITDDECMREGICSYKIGDSTYYNCKGIYIQGHPGVLKPFKTPRDAFFMLINKIFGWGYWNTNPIGFAYEFELIK